MIEPSDYQHPPFHAGQVVMLYGGYYFHGETVPHKTLGVITYTNLLGEYGVHFFGQYSGHHITKDTNIWLFPVEQPEIDKMMEIALEAEAQRRKRYLEQGGSTSP